MNRIQIIALELGVLVVVVVLDARVLIIAGVMLEKVSLQCMRKRTVTWPAAHAPPENAGIFIIFGFVANEGIC